MLQTAFFINQSYCLFRGDLLCLLPEEEVPFRRGAWVMVCCPGMSELRWLSRAGPALPAWCLSNRRCKVCGWCLKARVSLHRATVSSVCGVGDDLERSTGLNCRAPALLQCSLLWRCCWQWSCLVHAAAGCENTNIMFCVLTAQCFPRDFSLKIWLLKLALAVVRQLCQSFLYSWSVACLGMNLWNILRMLTLFRGTPLF